MRYKAKILPDHLKATADSIGSTVPLILQHNHYGKVYGKVEIINTNEAIITSKSDRVFVGKPLSAGSMIMAQNRHEVLEVSLTDTPRFQDCVVLEELDDL